MPPEDIVPNVMVTAVTPTLLDMFGVEWKASTGIEGVSLYDPAPRCIDLLAHDLDVDRHDARVDHVELAGGPVGKIDHAISDVRAAIVDADDHCATIVEVRHAYSCAESELAMCGGQIVHIEPLTRRRLPAIERVGVVARFTVL